MVGDPSGKTFPVKIKVAQLFFSSAKLTGFLQSTHHPPLM